MWLDSPCSNPRFIFKISCVLLSMLLSFNSVGLRFLICKMRIIINTSKYFVKSKWVKPGKWLGFPCGSAGKESACNAGDLGSIPGLGRSPGEGKGYPLQYSGLKNSPFMGSQRVRHDWVTFTYLLKLNWFLPEPCSPQSHPHPSAAQAARLGVILASSRSHTWFPLY